MVLITFGNGGNVKKDGLRQSEWLGVSWHVVHDELSSSEIRLYIT
jgi:hypothetical protein